MQALEVIAGFSTGDTTALTALTPATGNSFTIRNAPFDSQVHLLTVWSWFQALGPLQIRSPRMHDNVRGLRYNVPATDAQILLDPHDKVPMIPQDTLNVEADGGAAAADIAAVLYLLYYTNLPGVDARLVDSAYVDAHKKSVVTVENALTLGAVGNWSGAEAINAESDLLKANTDYALVGYTCSVAIAGVRWTSVDTGNLGVGGPGLSTSRFLTANWFRFLSDASGFPCIPVLNSANKGGIFIDGFKDENAAAPIIESILVELG